MNVRTPGGLRRALSGISDTMPVIYDSDKIRLPAKTVKELRRLTALPCSVSVKFDPPRVVIGIAARG